MLRNEASASYETATWYKALHYRKKIEAHGRTEAADKNRNLLFKKKGIFVFFHGNTESTELSLDFSP
ncbi:hypothetical protein [uncultured Pedobacter sp.]|uniref:hypothetical protein n=1 Tax=uncultured Pedobacter sp. TaxID=246139 RepID=UPI0025D02160|nr:hypothetical protein [uncultured Pedobacter sp.]